MLKNLLLIVDTCLILGLAYFMYESIREQEPRSPKVAAGGILFGLLLAILIIFAPIFRIPITIGFGIATIFCLICLIPGKPDKKAFEGAMGQIVGNPERHDERDISFARVRLIPDSGAYHRYYEKYPEKEEADKKRRDKGLLGTPGKIDAGYQPNVSMLHASFEIPDYLGPFAKGEPGSEHPPVNLSPERATEIVKGLTLHMGADLVGVCKVNPLWTYSNRGEIHYNNWDDWGKEIDDLPPYAVVFATEMDIHNVGTAPHTPSVVESASNYAKGAYISTILARWFAHMGYSGVAQNTRNYDMVLPPLAVDAGLGEVGRLGYLMAPKYGPRVRLFATLTDMPLVPDKPISIGGDEFCKRCMKCAESCPSKSITLDEKVMFKGAEKWKLNSDTCFEYWGKIGTDCCICMAICPFSRPDTLLHRVVRWFVARSPVACRVFPYIDNFLYGRKWHSKNAKSWIAYPRGKSEKYEVYGNELLNI